MATITIPKKIIKKDDIIILPRKEFENLFRLKMETVPLTKREKRALEHGFRQIRKGAFFTSSEVRHGLGL